MGKCRSCGRDLRAPRLTVKQFKKKFKAGDIITGYPTQKTVEILAIGKERFLYLDGRHERVGAIEAHNARWREKGSK